MLRSFHISCEGNRLYADVTEDGSAESIALPSDKLAETSLPGLKWNMSRTLDYPAEVPGRQQPACRHPRPLRRHVTGQLYS